MKILQINREFYLSGGSQRYFFDVSKLLKSYGHQVAFFSMTNQKNLSAYWSKYFVSNVSFKKKDIFSRLRLVERILHAEESQKKIKFLINSFRPDIVHIHNINIYISPLILPIIKKAGIPIIQTVHDYQLLSLTSGNLFHDGKICEITKKRSFYKALFHRCIRDSFKICNLFVLAQYIYHFLKLYDCIDYFIAPSIFLRNKMIDYGFDPTKILNLPYFVNLSHIKRKYYKKGDYIIYFGRLVPIKGLSYLIEAVRSLPEIKLVVVGKTDITNLQYENNLKKQSENFKNIQFAGYKTGSKLYELIAGSRFSILPSVWYEVFGISILESFAYSKPVIASDIGGIPEVVKDNYNGLLVTPRNSGELAKTIKKLWDDKQMCKRMGIKAKNYVVKNYGPRDHYLKLLDIYKKVLY